jgi:ABC-type Zn uptake system ZnuABC Zn-binding protein ZnuA
MGDVHAQGNPHYWLDPKNALLMAQAITERLLILDPDHRDAYQSNLAAFQQRLMDKMKAWQAALAPLKGGKVIAYHTSLIYLAKAFGFQIVDEVEPKPGISPTAAHLNRLIKRIEDDQIKLLIMEPYYEQRSAKFLQDKTGIRIGVIPQSVGAMPSIDDYTQLFDAIVAALKQAGDF